jgi:hypothetical protein
MEYPNKNLQLVMQRDAERVRREHELFGETLNLMSPERHMSTKFVFKRYGTAVTNMFDRFN